MEPRKKISLEESDRNEVLKLEKEEGKDPEAD